MSMNKIVETLVLCFVFLWAASGHAQAQVPVTQTASGRGDPNVRDAGVVDHFIPVVIMEQFYSGSTQLQGYRLQIFKDGQGIYHGLKNVKTLGEVRFRITQEQVQKIQNEFRKYKFWEVPEDQYGLPKGFGVLTLQFTLRDGEKSKTVRFGGERLAGMLQFLVETEANSARWRCPFEDENTRDQCSRLERYFEHTVPTFLKHDFPRLLETYK